MKAIGSKILVKEVEQEVLQEKIGNLTVPVGNSKEKMLCEVLSVGEEIKGLKPGDKIYTYYDPGHKFREAGEEYRIISLPDILVVL
jgi:co-chaperonin GroES (HSP10)